MRICKSRNNKITISTVVVTSLRYVLTREDIAQTEETDSSGGIRIGDIKLSEEKGGTTEPQKQKHLNWSFKWTVRPLFRIFSVVFKHSLQCLQQINVMRCWDLSPQHSYCESHPITTRPGLPLCLMFEKQ